MVKNNFIVTKNQSTAKSLIQMGYKLFKQDNGMWTFLNSDKIAFSNLEGAILTNKLFV